MPTPKSVCYICSNTYSASFDGAKDAAYTAKYGQPPEMKEGRGGRGRVPLRGKGVERTGKEGEGGEGRDMNKGRRGRGRGAALRQGGGKGREGKGRE